MEYVYLLQLAYPDDWYCYDTHEVYQALEEAKSSVKYVQWFQSNERDDEWFSESRDYRIVRKEVL